VRAPETKPWNKGQNMTSAANIVVSIDLDEETICDIEILRNIRLAHYEGMLKNPVAALETLKQAGLKEESSIDQVTANALVKIEEIKARISEPNIIYDDEISLYVDSLQSIWPDSMLSEQI
jgi:hypothetical protein